MKTNFAFILLVLLSIGLNAQSINVKRVEADGYDLVSYHIDAKAVEGSDKLSVQIDDVHYYFSSVEHQILFEKTPEKFLPKYGGYCAIGIAIYDRKYNVDPEDFLIDDGELYLFCPGEIDNWITDKENLKKLADQKWPVMKELKRN